MEILTLPEVNERQLNEIDALIKLCEQHENLKGDVFLSTDFNCDKSIRPFYLLYEDRQLSAFLFLFMPMPHEAEISAFVHPDRRRQGLFTQLLETAVDELREHHVPEILFVRETNGIDALPVLENLKAAYEFSEYTMKIDKTRFVAPPNEGKMTIKQAATADKQLLAGLSASIFNEEISAAETLMENSLKASDMTTYYAMVDGEVIGLCSVNHKELDKRMIYGLGISPQLQGRGYGRQMLSLLLTELIKIDCAQIALEVNSKNAAAFKLYESSGFAVDMQNDYYRYKIQ